MPEHNIIELTASCCADPVRDIAADDRAGRSCRKDRTDRFAALIPDRCGLYGCRIRQHIGRFLSRILPRLTDRCELHRRVCRVAVLLLDMDAPAQIKMRRVRQDDLLRSAVKSVDEMRDRAQAVVSGLFGQLQYSGQRAHIILHIAGQQRGAVRGAVHAGNRLADCAVYCR